MGEHLRIVLQDLDISGLSTLAYKARCGARTSGDVCRRLTQALRQL